MDWIDSTTGCVYLYCGKNGIRNLSVYRPSRFNRDRPAPKSVVGGAHQAVVAVLTDARKSAGLTRAELGRAVNEDQTFVSLIETPNGGSMSWSSSPCAAPWRSILRPYSPGWPSAFPTRSTSNHKVEGTGPYALTPLRLKAPTPEHGDELHGAAKRERRSLDR